MSESSAKLTPVAVMVLALLHEGEMHPYEMVRLLRMRRDERMVRVTNGTLYHSVRRLLADGLIAEVGTEREGNRPERTTYALTASGKSAMADWIRRELARIDRPMQFRVALAEAHNLDRDEVVGILRERRHALAAEAEELHALVQAGERDQVPAQFRIEVERQQALTEADLRWTDSLLDRLAVDGIPWGLDATSHSDRYRAQRKAAQQ